jgi:hypothetical protein
MVSRETGEVFIAPSTNVTGEDVLRRVVKNVDPGASVYHDDYRPYGILDGVFSHESVNHSAGEYPFATMASITLFQTPFPSHSFSLLQAVTSSPYSSARARAQTLTRVAQAIVVRPNTKSTLETA